MQPLTIAEPILDIASSRAFRWSVFFCRLFTFPFTFVSNFPKFLMTFSRLVFEACSLPTSWPNLLLDLMIVFMCLDTDFWDFCRVDKSLLMFCDCLDREPSFLFSFMSTRCSIWSNFSSVFSPTDLSLTLSRSLSRMSLTSWGKRRM